MKRRHLLALGVLSLLGTAPVLMGSNCIFFAKCPPPLTVPEPATYRVVSAYDPALVDATVIVTRDTVQIRYQRDGHDVVVTYDVDQYWLDPKDSGS